MFSLTSRFAELILFLHLFNLIACKVEFTNIQCNTLDPEFSDFEYCFIKSVNRTYKYFSLKVKLYKTPITKAKLNAAVLKRFSGYRPFLYNATVDACRFLKNPQSNPFVEYLYGFFSEYSNMNHTCPFTDDLIVEKLSINVFNQRLTNLLQFPHGDYLFETKWIAYDIHRANVKVYFTLS